jgi:hypothetical protein
LLRERRLQEGIPLSANDLSDLVALAGELGVPVPQASV